MKKFFIYGLTLIGAFFILNSCADSSIENKLADDTKYVNAENPDDVNANGEVDCDLIERKLKSTKEGTDEYKRLMAVWKKNCADDEDDEIDCDEIARKLKSTREGTDEYKRLMAIWKKNCGDEKDDEVDCDEIARKLKSTREGTEEYRRLMAIWKENCGKDKDDEIDCDVLARKLRATDPNSEEYKKLRAIYAKHCLDKEDDDEGKGTRVYRKENSEEVPTKKGTRAVKRGLKQD